MDRTENGWLVGPVGAIQDQYNAFWGQKVLSVLGEHWGVGLPNPLSGVWKQSAITQDSFSHLVAHAVDSELKTTYQQGLADLGQHFTQNHATDLLCELVYQWAGKKLSENRISVARNLVERGADWCDILYGEGLEDEQCIAALLQMASVQPSWATFFLDRFEPSQLLAFATTEERADALYARIPADYLLDRVGDGVRVRALEHDLGL